MVDSAADAGVEALRNGIGTNALAAETMPCDAAEGISAVTQIMASPLRRAEVATAWSWAAAAVRKRARAALAAARSIAACAGDISSMK